ncbi:MAG: DUF4258 domain-containing protein, partial [Deltaproteobacteria bacterium]|nr:DUF4258 domain-containing protein [Deltaproteobacteria bacterium]
VLFSGHAMRRMFERSIGPSAVTEVIRLGEVIEEYPDDEPFPSRLILGFVQGCPLHVVVAIEADSKTCYVVTAYDPDPDLWQNDFKARRIP